MMQLHGFSITDIIYLFSITRLIVCLYFILFIVEMTENSNTSFTELLLKTKSLKKTRHIMGGDINPAFLSYVLVSRELRSKIKLTLHFSGRLVQTSTV